jgi:nicotinate-nucleotide pyrophosphorylase (carboxylating)
MTAGSGVPASVPAHVVRDIVERALAEDLTPLGDLTSALLPPDVAANADLVSRADGILSGCACVDETYRQLDPQVVVRWEATDTDVVSPGMRVATVSGPLASVLTGERTALNLLGHLSGVATATSWVVDRLARSGSPTRVWDTRKTTPGLRALEKAAVRAGGGRNHRGNLSDWVMLKDNHLTVLGIAEGIAAARDRWPGRLVHVECDRLDQVGDALGAGADAVLLDNMGPELVREAVVLRNERRPDCLLEASGGIDLETVAAYGATGVDLVSLGAITNSAPVLDLGLDIRPVSSS